MAYALRRCNIQKSSPAEPPPRTGGPLLGSLSDSPKTKRIAQYGLAESAETRYILANARRAHVARAFLMGRPAARGQASSQRISARTSNANGLARILSDFNQVKPFHHDGQHQRRARIKQAYDWRTT